MSEDFMPKSLLGWALGESDRIMKEKSAGYEETIAALTSQRDRLLEACKVFVRDNPWQWAAGDDDVGVCRYCSGENRHRKDCPRKLAEETIAEVGAQTPKEAEG